MISDADRELVRRMVQRDESAFFQFYKKNKKPLSHFVLRYLKEKQDAEEVVQDTFFAFIEALRDFRGQSSLKTFLFSIGKRKVIDKLRRKKVRKIFFSHLPQGLVDSLATVFMDDKLDQKLLTEKIDRVLTSMPNDYARVLRLKYREGYKVAEVAAKVNLSLKATESLIFRARKAFVKLYIHQP